MGRRGKRGRTVRRNKQTKQNIEAEEVKRAPHSFVIHRGNVGQYIQDLTKDFRKVMEPFTASSLKVRKKNSVKDFVSVAGFLHVSHLVMFTRTEKSGYMRLCRLPRGPTLTFKIQNYSLSRDVLSQIKKQYVISKEFRHSPLVVLNSFSGEGAQMKLMTSMFQNMFPPLNLTRINLDTVRRCVLFNYNPDTKLIDFRHYGIRVVPVGLSRGVKKIVRSKVPNLSRFNDVSDFITKSEVLSDSEVEDDPNSHVTLPQKLSSRGNIASSQSAIRLSELGPRLNLQLMKVEAGLLDGEVLFHELVHKTEEEKQLISKRREERRRLKEKRKKIQEKNKEKKEAFKEELKQKSLEGIKRKQAESEEILKEAVEIENDPNEETDVDWYRKEVGEEPDADLFTSQQSSGRLKRKRTMEQFRGKKKPRLESSGKEFKKGGNFKQKKSFQSGNKEFSSRKKGMKKRTFGSKVTKGRRHR